MQDGAKWMNTCGKNKLEGLRAEIPVPAPAAAATAPVEEVIDEAKPKAKTKTAAH